MKVRKTFLYLKVLSSLSCTLVTITAAAQEASVGGQYIAGKDTQAAALTLQGRFRFASFEVSAGHDFKYPAHYRTEYGVDPNGFPNFLGGEVLVHPLGQKADWIGLGVSGAMNQTPAPENYTAEDNSAEFRRRFRPSYGYAVALDPRITDRVRLKVAVQSDGFGVKAIRASRIRTGFSVGLGGR